MQRETPGVIAGGKGEPVRHQTIIVPDPGPGKVVVRVQASGVCHTDLRTRAERPRQTSKSAAPVRASNAYLAKDKVQGDLST